MRRITFFKTLLVAIALIVGSINAFGQEISIYTTGFESADGFGISTVYNNVTPVIFGTTQSWSAVMGTVSTTSPISGLQSMQMRTYANNTTLGSATMNFDLPYVTKVTFNAQTLSPVTSLNAYYSTDYGVTWSTATAFTVGTTKTLCTYTVSVTGAYKAVRIKIENPTNNIASGRLYIDDVTVYGMTPATPLAVAPVISVASGKYVAQQNVTITSTTPGSTIYYTTDGTTPSDASTLYTGPIAVTSSKTIKAITYATGFETSLLSSASYTFPTNISTISLLKAADVSGFYKLTGEAILTFQAPVTYAKPKYVQDGTAGIMIYDSGSKITTAYNLYDGITGLIGTLSPYNGMVEFVPFTDPGAASSTANVVNPIVVNVANLANYSGQLVKVNNVTIAPTGTFAASTLYTMTDATSATGKLRTAYVVADLPYIGSAIPAVAQNITGVVLINSLTEADLIPRTIADFVNYTLATPTVGTASRVTLTGFTANWTAVANATSYDINVYDASNVLVTGFPKNATGATTQILAITSSGGVLLPNTNYTFTVTAKGDGITYANSVGSAKSSFTTATSGSFLLQYADVDAMTLNADIKAGAADIYELTTSGGAYTMNTSSTSNNNAFVRNSTVRALAGLAAKPIIKVISTTTGSTPNLFYTNTPNMIIRFDGLELSGLNTSPASAQLMLFLGGPLATNCNVYITNCLLHDFLNGSGNGLIRLDGTTGGLIDIQGSTIYNFGGRALFLNGSSTSSIVNLKNNTFYSNSLSASRADIIYNGAATTTWAGTITVDHCTFDHIVSTSTSECVIRNLTPATGGTITVSNSIFTTVGGAALYAYVTVNNSYVAGFTNAPLGVVTNSFAASPAPAYTDPTTYNFRLTNAGSFICPDGLVAGNTYTFGVPSGINATLITAVGFTANWTAVANASSYDVKVYDGTPALVKTVNVTGAATATAAITGLTASTPYTFTVTAKGDGTNLADSPESGHANVSTNAFVTLATPTVGAATRVTLTGFTANWTAVANATSYDVNVYDASNVLVTGSPFNVAGATTATLAVNKSGGLLALNTAYTFTVTAKGDAVNYLNSSESDKSTPFTTATSGSFVLQYAAADVMTLNTDIKAGAADIYELTESGGAYTFSTTLSDNNSIIRSTTIRAAAGLAAKPIIKLITTSTSGTADMFNVQIANITVNLNGLEFNGINTALGGTQPIIFYAKSVNATNFKIYVTNCLIHDFYNASGNGIIRLDGITAAAPTGVIDIQNTTIYNFSARALYLNPANNVTNAYSVNLKNNTFNTNSILSSRANIIYSAGGSGYWSGSITIDHCTFNNIVASSGTECIIRQLTPATGGTITVSNSIFTTVGGAALYAYVTVNNSYVAGFTNAPLGTVTNSFAVSPAPAYTSGTDFRLTNVSSFICPDGTVAGNTYGMLAIPSVVAGATNPTSSGFTANWEAVFYASGYDVKVYDATHAQVGSTINVAGGYTSVAVTGLNSNASYTYTVTAKGGNVTYFDSPASAASAPVSTLVSGLNRTETGIATIWVNNRTIICSETGSMEVYNLQGAKVLQAQNVNKVATTLENGLYIVRFTGSNGQMNNTKIIIK